jgi:hypothetical protein
MYLCDTTNIALTLSAIFGCPMWKVDGDQHRKNAIQGVYAGIPENSDGKRRRLGFRPQTYPTRFAVQVLPG